MLAWQETKGKKEPWNNNRLTLFCSLDTRSWTAEGTELIRQKQLQSHQRHKTQRNNSSVAFNQNDSELGNYLDRIISKAIVTVAESYHAGSIVVPNLNNIRDSIQTEIQSRAEAKIPGCLEAQKKYLKNYRVNVHQWSYRRLIDNLKVQASKINIGVEEVKQPIRGSPQEKAKEMALLAYQFRSVP